MTFSPQTTDAESLAASGIEFRPSDSRGFVDFGWLKGAHSFSFGEYRNPDRVHFGALRVINDDHIAPGSGFPLHGHRDADIFSYVLAGEIAHKDSLGNGSTVSAGGVQFMTAGAGVEHSEFNPSDSRDTHMLQIWLLPAFKGAEPRYEVKDLDRAALDGTLHLFVSEDGREGSIKTLAPADVYAGRFTGSQTADIQVKAGRQGYIHMAKGAARIGGYNLSAGDALALSRPGTLSIDEATDAEILFFDLGPYSG